MLRTSRTKLLCKLKTQHGIVTPNALLCSILFYSILLRSAVLQTAVLSALEDGRYSPLLCIHPFIHPSTHTSTPLHSFTAVRMAHVTTAEMLVARGARDALLEAPHQKSKKTPLMQAAEKVRETFSIYNVCFVFVLC
jgi:hypothetical protein